jgi:hypothetical protein
LEYRNNTKNWSILKKEKRNDDHEAVLSDAVMELTADEQAEFQD